MKLLRYAPWMNQAFQEEFFRPAKAEILLSMFGFQLLDSYSNKKGTSRPMGKKLKSELAFSELSPSQRAQVLQTVSDAHEHKAHSPQSFILNRIIKVRADGNYPAGIVKAKIDRNTAVQIGSYRGVIRTF